MARGPKRHLKRHNAPKHWMLDKLSGVFAPRPSTGPHKLRECVPLILLLRNRLKYALNNQEVKFLCKSKQVRVDGKICTNHKYPIGLGDLVELYKKGSNTPMERFHILINTKGRFVPVKASAQQRNKLLQVKQKFLGPKGIPHLVFHDGRTMRYPKGDVKIGDSVLMKLQGRTNFYAVEEVVTMEVGCFCLVFGGKNKGRIGHLTSIESHPGGFDMVHIKDNAGHTFNTRQTNIMVIGKEKSIISLPEGKGIKKSIIEEQQERERLKQQ